MCEWGNTVTVDLRQSPKPVDLDRCIVDLVRTLNDAGFYTVASCCGHKNPLGNIALRDGRELIIVPDWETARRVERAFYAEEPKDD